jgi:cell division protein FtsB
MSSLSMLYKELKTENDALKAENASLKRDIEKIKAVLGITHKAGI